MSSPQTYPLYDHGLYIDTTLAACILYYDAKINDTLPDELKDWDHERLRLAIYDENSADYKLLNNLGFTGIDCAHDVLEDLSENDSKFSLSSSWSFNGSITRITDDNNEGSYTNTDDELLASIANDYLCYVPVRHQPKLFASYYTCAKDIIDEMYEALGDYLPDRDMIHKNIAQICGTVTC